MCLQLKEYITAGHTPEECAAELEKLGGQDAIICEYKKIEFPKEQQFEHHRASRSLIHADIASVAILSSGVRVELFEIAKDSHPAH